MKQPPLHQIHSDHFSLELYRETLQKAIRCGYRFPTVSKMQAGANSMEKFLLLRHDIDSSPQYALRMAKLESELGVRSSYYVLMHSPFYNPGAPRHWDALQEMIHLGFEVGLHYDTEFFERRNLDPLEGVLRDVTTLEAILQIKIGSVSQHRPASGTFLKHLNNHYVDAYNQDLMQNVFYISDSGFKWRDKSLIDVIGQEDRIHALIHPLTWTFGELDMAGTYHRATDDISGEIRVAFESFIQSTNEYLSKREQLDAARKAQYTASGR